MADPRNDRLIFELVAREGFKIEAFDTGEPDARVIITRSGKPFRVGSYPAYRVWNLYAHFPDMVEEFLADEPEKA